jgi:hypothetical protein
MSEEVKSTPQSEWNKRNRERINQRERERYYSDHEYREHIKAIKRKQYHDLSDEVKAERNAKTNAKQRDRYHNDPEYREECKRKALERYYKTKEAKNVQ